MIGEGKENRKMTGGGRVKGKWQEEKKCNKNHRRRRGKVKGGRKEIGKHYEER